MAVVCGSYMVVITTHFLNKHPCFDSFVFNSILPFTCCSWFVKMYHTRPKIYIFNIAVPEYFFLSFIFKLYKRHNSLLKRLTTCPLLSYYHVTLYNFTSHYFGTLNIICICLPWYNSKISLLVTWKYWKVPSSMMWHHVVLQKLANILEEQPISIIRIKE